MILVSTSKAGPETQLALDRLERAGKAGHVAAWVNIGGLLNGTPLADHWEAWPRSWLAALAFAFMGHGTESIGSMTTGARRPHFAALRLPAGVLVVTYIGAPRASEVNPGAQNDYAIIAPHGPNDGMTLLADALLPQGITVVERGLDHYFRRARPRPPDRGDGAGGPGDVGGPLTLCDGRPGADILSCLRKPYARLVRVALL